MRVTIAADTNRPASRGVRTRGSAFTVPVLSSSGTSPSQDRSTDQAWKRNSTSTSSPEHERMVSISHFTRAISKEITLAHLLLRLSSGLYRYYIAQTSIQQIDALTNKARSRHQRTFIRWGR